MAMTSGPDGKETIERLARAAGIPVANLAGKTAPRVLAAVMARSKLYVGYNTGPMHVGAAVGTPIVTLFEEPSKFPEWRPWS
ncbi:glycosyltransferase family 9 protein, partial [Klebsiella pneumoniae]|uniref:glycosyltransferase family 9 protein n=1 Tax=Klebsiella pneumoniae TaxID=573 RepID=UPI003EE321EB